MSKLKTWLKRTFSYGAVRHDVPVTFAAVCAATLLAFVWMILEVNAAYPPSSAIYERVQAEILQLLMMAAMFAVGALAAETLLAGRGRYLLFGIWAAVTYVMVGMYADGKTYLVDLFRPIRMHISHTRMNLLLIGLCGTVLILAIYGIVRKYQEMSLGNYVFRVYCGEFLVGVICGILNVGVLVLSLIFTTLIYGDVDKLFPPALVLVIGGYFVLNTLRVLVKPAEEEDQKLEHFMELLVRYVLLIQCLISYVILYLYIFKILFLQKFPSNSVYGILAAMFVYSMPVGLMCSSFQQEGQLQKVAGTLPLVFLPLWVLQSWTALVRVFQYGMTVKRYAGLAVLVAEAIYIGFYLADWMRRRKGGEANPAFLKRVLPVLAGLLILCTIVPGINALDLSKVLARANASNGGLGTALVEDSEILYASWNYATSLPVDISDYSTLTSACVSLEYDETNRTPVENLAELEITEENIENLLPGTIDVRDMVREMETWKDDIGDFKAEQSQDGMPGDVNEDGKPDTYRFDLKNGNCFVATYADLQYDSDSGDVVEFNMYGYYLGK